MEHANHYIGLDFSTQQIKAVVINESLEVLAQEHVHFDSDLPQYSTHGGVHVSGSRVTAPTLMWVEALDLLLDKLRGAGVDFSLVDGVSGVGQQHGSVYWRRGIASALDNLDPAAPLRDQLAGWFSVEDSPIWMDSSTSAECSMLEEAAGGAESLARITGSRAYERFTGNQIAKLRKDAPEAYSNTERISLVSSFAASLFVGDIAPIDWADAGGMNILDIKTKTWCPRLLEAIGPDLHAKLGEPVFGSTVVGSVSSYMQERYGFKPTCRVAAFTGDNPGSLAGLALGQNDIGFSLGTSDTVFVWLKDPHPQLTGHVWPNPVEKDDYMALLCYKNGSLTRERLRDSLAGGTWEKFNQLLEGAPSGNGGNMGFYFDLPEIVPHGLEGDYRFNESEERVESFESAGNEVRALVEGQIMAKRIHAENMGFIIGADTRILVTGGGSVNQAVLQVIADIFNAPVYTQVGANSAALGGAYIALHACQGGEATRACQGGEATRACQGGEATRAYSDVVSAVREAAKLASSPAKNASQVYSGLMQKYRRLEAKVVQLCKDKEDRESKNV